MPKVFSEEEERFLRKNFRKFSNKELAEKLNTTERSIEAKLRRLGLRRKEKVKEVEKVTEVKPKEKDKALCLYEEGLFKLREGEYAEARKRFERIIKEFPERASICDRAKTYITICDRRLSEEIFTPKTAEDFYYLGIIHGNRGEYEEALSYYQKALGLSPNNEKILYLIAGAYAQLGKEKEAIKNLKRAIELNPANRILAREEDDFAPLREKKEFIKLTGSTKKD
ncbi:MAG: tetratricopeptide repeat protein [Acidobacteria bacterium]|nr:tetratricopeptide repeat protein [Acidobacteriota bacterium]